jgi:lipoprotein-anchoring transpeptidase ErfK/SrfK
MKKSRISFTSLALVAAALSLFVPAAAKSDTTPVSWSTPTPADQSRFAVKAGEQLSFTLSAATTLPGAFVHIAAAKALPSGALFSSADGAAAQGSFSWKPSKSGDYTLKFTASTVGAGSAPMTLTYVVHVTGSKPSAKTKVQYPRAFKLTDDKVAHWAAVVKTAVVRAQPTEKSRKVTTLPTRTTDDTQNLVLVLQSKELSPSQTWYRVRLPILPNNSTGWVKAASLGDLWTVHTHLYVDLAHMRATLKRDGVTVFKTVVGVGKSVWPTPRGEYYIRTKMTSFSNPVYGPIAFGTSARSPVLTDWPGGGYVGVHGTNEPSILPGRVSHGCIRMKNEAILKLATLMPVGTPLTVS